MKQVYEELGGCPLSSACSSTMAIPRKIKVLFQNNSKVCAPLAFPAEEVVVTALHIAFPRAKEIELKWINQNIFLWYQDECSGKMHAAQSHSKGHDPSSISKLVIWFRS